MSDSNRSGPDFGDSTLQRLGVKAWLWLGIIGLITVVYLGLASLSGLVIPLVVAAVIGMLLVPVVDWLSQYMRKAIASSLVLLLLTAVAVFTIGVTVRGVIDQGPEIQAQLESGLTQLLDWLNETGWDINTDQLLESIQESLSNFIPGAASLIGTVFSSVAAFLIGTFIAVFMLFFVMADWEDLSTWVGGHLGVPQDLGAGIVDDTVWSMRQHFYVLTWTAILTGILIGGSMWVLGLPLAFTVGAVTFLTSYIPYLGAIFSGAFAFLIALGGGGGTDALIVLAVILVVQNVLQPVLIARFNRDALHLHPIVTFGSTIVGAAVAGLLGATLSAPIVAMMIAIQKRLKAYWHPEVEPAADADANAVEGA